MCISSRFLLTKTQSSSLPPFSQYPPHLSPYTHRGTAHLFPFPQHFRWIDWHASFTSGTHRGNVFPRQPVWRVPFQLWGQRLICLPVVWQRRQNTCRLYAACTLTGTPPLHGVNQPDDTLIFIAHQGGDLEVCRPGGEEGIVCMSNHSSNAAYRKKLQNTEALCHQIFPLALRFPQRPNLP